MIGLHGRVAVAVVCHGSIADSDERAAVRLTPAIRSRVSRCTRISLARILQHDRDPFFRVEADRSQHVQPARF